MTQSFTHAVEEPQKKWRGICNVPYAFVGFVFDVLDESFVVVYLPPPLLSKQRFNSLRLHKNSPTYSSHAMQKLFLAKQYGITINITCFVTILLRLLRSPCLLRCPF